MEEKKNATQAGQCPDSMDDGNVLGMSLDENLCAAMSVTAPAEQEEG